MIAERNMIKGLEYVFTRKGIGLEYLFTIPAARTATLAIAYAPLNLMVGLIIDVRGRFRTESMKWLMRMRDTWIIKTLK